MINYNFRFLIRKEINPRKSILSSITISITVQACTKDLYATILRLTLEESTLVLKLCWTIFFLKYIKLCSLNYRVLTLFMRTLRITTCNTIGGLFLIAIKCFMFIFLAHPHTHSSHEPQEYLVFERKWLS